MKANFSAVDGPALLAKIAALPVSTWNYKTQPPSVRHLGPMAQDFRAAFGLGEDERHISTIDSEGVALAGIQALYQQLEQLKQDRDKQIEQLRLDRDRLAVTVTQVQARLEKLEKSKAEVTKAEARRISKK